MYSWHQTNGGQKRTLSGFLSLFFLWVYRDKLNCAVSCSHRITHYLEWNSTLLYRHIADVHRASQLPFQAPGNHLMLKRSSLRIPPPAPPSSTLHPSSQHLPPLHKYPSISSRWDLSGSISWCIIHFFEFNQISPSPIVSTNTPPNPPALPYQITWANFLSLAIVCCHLGESLGHRWVRWSTDLFSLLLLQKVAVNKSAFFHG